MNRTAELLREIMFSDNYGVAGRIAERANLAYQTVHSQTDGRSTPSVELVRAAFLETLDPRIKRILEPQGYELVPRAQGLTPTGSLVEEIGDIHDATADLRRQAKAAAEDGRLDREETNALLRLAGQVEMELAEVKAVITQKMEGSK